MVGREIDETSARQGPSTWRPCDHSHRNTCTCPKRHQGSSDVGMETTSREASRQARFSRPVTWALATLLSRAGDWFARVFPARPHNPNYSWNPVKRGEFALKPENFSNIGYLSILVGLVLILWGLAEFQLAGNAFAIFSL